MADCDERRSNFGRTNVAELRVLSRISEDDSGQFSPWFECESWSWLGFAWLVVLGVQFTATDARVQVMTRQVSPIRADRCLDDEWCGRVGFAYGTDRLIFLTSECRQIRVGEWKRDGEGRERDQSDKIRRGKGGTGTVGFWF